jgi:tRNA(Arg) A34 adenosine deaminase TadA
MPKTDRRAVIVGGGCGLIAFVFRKSTWAFRESEKHFISEAARMKREAVSSGDEPFGAVMVKGGAIVGYGPSRVILDRNPNAHAERVALWDAQRRLGTKEITGAVIYSTSRPCAACEDALALANVERMYFGADGADGGRPRRSR